MREQTRRFSAEPPERYRLGDEASGAEHPRGHSTAVAWLHGDGAMTLDVVAGVVTVLKQAG
ncbi:hypothetical protein [Actinophytocola algeriensis]|uniref:Uncharacterized protein n=1 Tax=Actinophytocola algeriensis TaxID=1768010 RepID=A0A7W7QFT1_9PSEU|nr:hypothetical protein [Actinophytocola algeriensis]MBB4912638.1 hypothetical protein [Actinophytocola algeriensis]MBE1472028.1 hypothetical protein [Actinophytocola algeriensis]